MNTRRNALLNESIVIGPDEKTLLGRRILSHPQVELSWLPGVHFLPSEE